MTAPKTSTLTVVICSLLANSVLAASSAQSQVVEPANIAAAGGVLAPANVVAPSATMVAESPIGVAHVPAEVGTAISKTVHYAETPVVRGYMSTLYKADLSAFETPFKFNLNQRYLRPVKTIIPKVMPVMEPKVISLMEPKVMAMMEPKANLQLPVVTPLKEVEIHPPILPEVRVANPIYYPPVIAPFIH